MIFISSIPGEIEQNLPLMFHFVFSPTTVLLALAADAGKCLLLAQPFTGTITPLGSSDQER